MRNSWSWIFAPISWLYGIALSIRHQLYDSHLLPTYLPDVLTISVGNLALGGTGKTPHTEYLIELLSRRYKVAVLSRGYGRKTRGFLLADSTSVASQIGDEPMQMHLHFPTIPVAVCENRIKGINRICRLFPDTQIIILDDAMQHRKLTCTYNLLLTEYNRLYIDDSLIPVGRLRDLKSRALKADMVVVTKCPPTMRPIDRRVIDNRLQLPAFQHLVFSSYQYAELPKKGNPLLVTGIANPEPLLSYVSAQCPDAGHLCYSDHHHFSQRDVDTILREAEKYDYVLTTEKDKVRFDEIYLSEALGSKLYTMPVNLKVDAEFDSILLTFFSEKFRKMKK